MGVINMAHGELIMIGAYATYVVQNLFRSDTARRCSTGISLAAFRWRSRVAPLVGMVLERTVIRFLYGRPLETLLATWGISLDPDPGACARSSARRTCRSRTRRGCPAASSILPTWCCRGAGSRSSRSRSPCSSAVWLLLTRTRLGLFVRGVTQNRGMAGCVGVPHRARRHVGVRPRLGHRGPRRRARSRRSATSGPTSARATSSTRSWWSCSAVSGSSPGPFTRRSVLGIVEQASRTAGRARCWRRSPILVFIMVFIQKRPQGMFALKGRAVEA